MAETVTPEILPDIGQEEKTGEKSELEPGYLVICWNDPVNLMDYVTHVFQTVFGWKKSKAEHHMLQVHNQGKSVLTRESLEKAEHYVHLLQKYSLHATMERDSVNFIKAHQGGFSFQIGPKEKRLLFELLKLYPLIPAAHAQLSRTEERAEDQQLLEEALAAHRQANQKQVLAMLKAKSRFRANKKGFRFSLKAAQMEWLIQVLNDVRVGSWLVLGSPDGPLEILAALNEKTTPYLWAMEAAGNFQMVLLKAMNAA